MYWFGKSSNTPAEEDPEGVLACAPAGAGELAACAAAFCFSASAAGSGG